MIYLPAAAAREASSCAGVSGQARTAEARGEADSTAEQSLSVIEPSQLAGLLPRLLDADELKREPSGA